MSFWTKNAFTELNLGVRQAWKFFSNIFIFVHHNGIKTVKQKQAKKEKT